MTHTRAPWKVGNDNGFWGQDCCIQANDPEVGTVVICDFVHSSAIEEEANKALIMAAPDLLEALKAIQEAFIKGEIAFTRKRQSDSDPYHPANVKMTAAIAKGSPEQRRRAGSEEA